MPTQPKQNFTWLIGGPQGSGVNSSAEVYAKIMTRLGYYVFSRIEHHSNIKGKHSNYLVRTANYRIRSHVETIDMLVVLDEESLLGDFYQTYPTHWGLLHKVHPQGLAIYDRDTVTDLEAKVGEDHPHLVGLPFIQIIDQTLAAFGKAGQGKKYAIMKNAVALGASLGLLSIDRSTMDQAIRESFAAKKKAADMNVGVARAAYDYARHHFSHYIRPYFASPGLHNQILINGSKAVGIAKIRAGCGFQSYYPISPATAESEYLEKHQSQYMVQVIQSEDEIAAVNMAAAAAHGGLRASTSTSGPGFALMAEGIGYAAITEAPGPVICLYQRAGPSTGIPTRQEQGDLRTSLHSGQGAYPFIALAPGDLEEYFYDTFDIFNLCDQYQLPAIMLYDKHGARTMLNMTPFDDTQLEIDQGPRYSNNTAHPYQRYDFKHTPVTPRSIPGEEDGIFWTSSDEHQQDGHITEGTANRMAMMHKRMSKLELMLKTYPKNKQIKIYGDPEADTAIITWGTTKGVLLDLLEDRDKPCDFKLIQVRLLHPFPETALTEALKGVSRTICYEQNHQGELAGLIQENTLQAIHHRVLKFDGRPFSYDEALAGLNEVFTQPRKRIVLSEGQVRDETTWGYEAVQQLVEEKHKRPKQAKTATPLPPGYNR